MVQWVQQHILHYILYTHLLSFIGMPIWTRSNKYVPYIQIFWRQAIQYVIISIPYFSEDVVYPLLYATGGHDQLFCTLIDLQCEPSLVLHR